MLCLERPSGEQEGAWEGGRATHMAYVVHSLTGALRGDLMGHWRALDRRAIRVPRRGRALVLAPLCIAHFALDSQHEDVADEGHFQAAPVLV